MGSAWVDGFGSGFGPGFGRGDFIGFARADGFGRGFARDSFAAGAAAGILSFSSAGAGRTAIPRGAADFAGRPAGRGMRGYKQGGTSREKGTGASRRAPRPCEF